MATLRTITTPARRAGPARGVGAAWVALAVACVAGARAQTPPARDAEYLMSRWETEEGMPDGSATAMAQDRRGFLWIGTFGGLVRFDGAAFTTFNRANTPGLPGDGIFNLYFDRSDRLWASTLDGLGVREGGTWRAVGTGEPWARDLIRNFVERPNGDMLLTTLMGRLLENTGGPWREIPGPPDGRPELGYWGTVDEVGHWWVVQSGMVAEWDGQRWTKRAETPKLPADRIASTASRDGGRWVLAGRQLRKFRGQQQVSLLTLPEVAGGVWGMSEDSQGNVWISSYDQGVYRVSPEGKLRRWGAENGLGTNSARFVQEDAEHNLWVGTSGAGLTRLTARRVRSYGREQGITEPVINGVCPDGAGGAWAASYGSGLYRLRGGVATHQPLLFQERPVFYLQSVLRDRAGRIWAGLYTNGLLVSGDEGGSWEFVPPKDTGGANVVALYEDAAGRVWSAGGRTLAMHAGGTHQLFGVDQGLPEGPYPAFCEDSRGRLWVAGRAGVFRLEDGRFAPVTDRGAKIEDVSCLFARRDGSVWLGGPGVRRWRDGAVSRLHPGSGWPDLRVVGFVEDGEGFWWMPTSRGILRARGSDVERAMDGEPGRVRVQVFDRSDGMTTVDCTGGRFPVCGRDDSGVLWFATSKGVEVISPAAVRMNEVPPQMSIEGVAYTTAEGVRVESGEAGGGLALPALSRRLEIRYTAVSLSAPEKVRFQTRMSDGEAEWQDVGARRTASFDDLRPGTYQFQVRACNNDGVWSMTPATLSFSLAAPFWRTWWFLGVVAGVATAVTAGTVWVVTAASYRRERERMELRQHRHELIHLTRVNMLGELSGALAHELSQPLTAILTNAQAAQRFLVLTPPDTGELGEILADIVKEDRRAGEIIHRLKHLLRKGEVERQPLEVDQLVEDVLKLTRSDLVNRNLAAHADVPEGLPHVRGDRVQVQQVLLNLVMNAADAMADGEADGAAGRTILVRASLADRGTVRISVVDRGPGIPEGHTERVFTPFYTTKTAGLGLGLSMCRTIVGAHGGRIWAENNETRGATFHFTLPVTAEGAA